MSKPQALPRFYNFANVIFSVDEIILSDYDEDGGVDVEYVSPDVVESSVGADGLVHVDYVNDSRLRFTVKLKALSFASQYLDRLYRTWKSAIEQGVGLVPINVLLLDPASGETIADPNCYFVTIPGKSKNKGQGGREFVIEAPYGRDNEQSGTITNPPVRI